MLPPIEEIRRTSVTRFRRELMSLMRRREIVVITVKGKDTSVFVPVEYL